MTQPLVETLPGHPAPAAELRRLEVVAPRLAPAAPAWREVLIALHSLVSTVALEVHIDPDRVVMAVACDRETSSIVERALAGALPDCLTRDYAPAARVTPHSVRATLVRSSAGPWAPIRSCEQFANSDPLSALLEAFEPRALGERHALRLLIRPASVARCRDAAKGITLPSLPRNLWDILPLGLGSAQRVARFEPTLQRRLEDRLAQPLFDVLGQVLLSGPDADRLRSRTASLAAALWGQFNDGFGGIELAPLPDPEAGAIERAGRGSGLLLTAGELAALWHLPSEQVQVDGISYVTRPSRHLPLALRSVSGLSLGTHEHRGQEERVSVSPFDLLQGPAVVVGRSGTGKSTAIHQLLAGVSRLEERPSIGIIDPNVQLVDDFLAHSVPPEREEDVVLLDLGDTDHPVNLSFLACPEGVPMDAFVENRFGLLRVLFEEHWSASRMEDAAYALMALLCRVPNATLLDAPRVFGDHFVRREALRNLDDPVAMDFWNQFDQYPESTQRDLAAPLLHRLRKFYRSPAVRNMLCGDSCLDFNRLLSAGSLLLVSLGGAAIQAEANFLGEFIIGSLHLALNNRLTQPQNERRSLFLAIDESHRFRSGSLPTLLREGRKLGLSLTLCTQYLSAWSEDLAEAVLGNSGSLICFRPGPKDARALAQSLPPYRPEELESLDRYQAVARLQVNGETLPAFDFRTEAVRGERDEPRSARIRERSRSLYATPRAEVEARFSQPREFERSRRRKDLDGA